MSTIDFYNKNVENYYARTIDIDMSDLYDFFLRHIPKKGHILDAGCGVGRDTKHFLSLGYQVTSIDASEAMVELSSKISGQRSYQMRFQDLAFSNSFDGIWASASLLHVPKKQMHQVFSRFITALKVGGVWYLSFKVGEGERVHSDGRTYTDFSEKSFRDFISSFDRCIDVINILSDQPSKAGSTLEAWLSILIRKSSPYEDQTP